MEGLGEVHQICLRNLERRVAENWFNDEDQNLNPVLTINWQESNSLCSS